MGADVYSGKGYVIGLLEDLVWNKDSGKVSYLIVTPQQAESGTESVYFAIHHSYFYLEGPKGHLTFNPKIGKDDYSFFLDLPVLYEDMDVQDSTAFNRYVVNHSAVASHRSDNEGFLP